MTITVYGSPVAQGNHRTSQTGVIYETTKGHRPWRDSVGWAAREAGGRVAGPVQVSMSFTLPKPASAPKRRVTYPDRKPDLSKLVRAVEDALTDAGVWEDDARVIKCVSRKVFPGESPFALDRPGCVIEIEAVNCERHNNHVSVPALRV